MTLGDYIKRYRQDNGMSMDEFSKKCGLSKSYISMLERNRDGRGNPIFPKIETVEKVSKAINIDVEDVLRTIEQKVVINSTPEHDPYISENLTRMKYPFMKELTELYKKIDIDDSINKAYEKIANGYIPYPLWGAQFFQYMSAEKPKYEVRVGKVFSYYMGLFTFTGYTVSLDNEMPEIIYLKGIKSGAYSVVPTLDIYKMLVSKAREFSECLFDYLDERNKKAKERMIPDDISKYSIAELEKALNLMKELSTKKEGE